MLPGDADLLLVVAAALIDDARRVLIQQRPPGKPMAGLWEFPGGKVEAGEAPEAALARELEEELGIALDAADLAPLAFVSEGRLVLLLYAVRKWRRTPVAYHASALLWATPEEMRALAMPPADVPLVDALARALSSGA